MKDKEKRNKFKNKIKMREYLDPKKKLSNIYEEVDRCHLELAFIYGKMVRFLGNKDDNVIRNTEIILNMGYFLKIFDSCILYILNVGNLKKSVFKNYQQIKININHYINELIIYTIKFVLLLINFNYKFKNIILLEKYINKGILLYKYTKNTDNINIIRVHSSLLLSINKYFIYNKKYKKVIEIYFKVIEILFIEIYEIESLERQKILNKRKTIKFYIRKNKCYKKILIIAISLFYVYIKNDEYKKAFESLTLLKDLLSLFNYENDEFSHYINNLYSYFYKFSNDFFIKENIIINIIKKTGNRFSFISNEGHNNHFKKLLITNNHLKIDLIDNDKKKIVNYYSNLKLSKNNSLYIKKNNNNLDETHMSFQKKFNYNVKKKDKITTKKKINFSKNMKKSETNKNFKVKKNMDISINNLLKESYFCNKEGKKLLNNNNSVGKISKDSSIYQNLNDYFNDLIQEKCKLKKNFKEISISTFNQQMMNNKEKICDNFQKKINKLSNQHNKLLTFNDYDRYDNLSDFILLSDYYKSLNNNVKLKNMIKNKYIGDNKNNNIKNKNKLFNIIKKNYNKIKINNILYMKKKISEIEKPNSTNYDNFNKDFFISMKNKYHNIINHKINNKNIYNPNFILDKNIKQKEKDILEINKEIENHKGKIRFTKKNMKYNKKFNEFIDGNSNLIRTTKGLNFKNYIKNDMNSFFKILKAKIYDEKLKNPKINLTSVVKLL